MKKADYLRLRGFTLVELLVTVAILGLLAGLAIPSIEIVVKRNKEQELKSALREIRSAIDEYKKNVDSGLIESKVGDSGYPPNLEILYKGILDKTDPDKQKKIYLLRRLPRDPFFPDQSANPSDTWGKRSYESSYDKPAEGKDVFDVYSLSKDVGINGISYEQW